MKKIFLLLCALISTLSFAAEKSLYDFSWIDKDKEIYVLQNRKFRKDGAVYIGGTLNKTVGSAFIDAYGGTARAGYFFREDWGIEGVFGKSTGRVNDVGHGVSEQGTVPYYRKIDSYMGAMLMWSPFYSKINTFNKVFYFDWMFGAGLASISTLNNKRQFDPDKSSVLTKENSTGLLWNTGFRFYISEHWSLRLDLTGLMYSATKTGRPTGGSLYNSTKYFYNYDLGLGLNYQF